MNNRYFQSEEFLFNLKYYEEKLASGESIYLDEDDFADIADYYMSENRPEDSMIAVDKGLLAHADSEGLLTVKSSVYIFQREFEMARPIVENLDSDNSDVYYQLAQLKYALDMDSAESERMFRKWIGMDNGEYPTEQMKREAYIHVISSFVELRGINEDTGEKAWDLTLVRNWIEEYIEKFQPLGGFEEDVQVAEICRENSLIDLVIKTFSQILEEKPYLKRGWTSLALGYYSEGKYENANEAADFALAIDPDDKDALLTKAHVVYELGDKEGCIPLFEEYLDRGGAVYNVLPLVDAFFSTGLKDIHTIRRFLQLLDMFLMLDKYRDPFLPQDQMATICDMLSEIATVLYRYGKYNKAKQFLEKALQYDETNFDAYFLLGSIYSSCNQMKEAYSEFMKGLQYCEDKGGYCLDIIISYIASKHYHHANELIEALDAPSNQGFFVDKVIPARALLCLAIGEKEQFLYFFKEAMDISKDITRSMFEMVIPREIPFEEWYAYTDKEFETLKTKI